MRKFLKITGVIFCLLLVFSFTVQAVVIFVSPKPTRVRLKAKPGSQVSGEIEVNNPTEYPVNIRAYLEDYIIDEKGSPGYRPRDSQPNSCSSWTEVYPEVFQIPPNQKATLRYVVSVPEDAKGTYYTVVFFESFGDKLEGEKGVTVNVVGRIGSHIAVLTEGTVSREISDFSIEVKRPEPDKPLVALYAFKNKGNVDILVEGDYSIVDSKNNFFGRGRFSPARAMGGNPVQGRTQLPAELTPGKYLLISTFQVGPDDPPEIIVKETEFEVK